MDLSGQRSAFQREIDKLCEFVARSPQHLQKCAPQISGWSPAEHICHLVKADTNILNWCRQGKEVAGSINLIGRILLFVGWLPRGVVQAPESTRPEKWDASRLLQELTAIRALSEQLDDSNGSAAVFLHPRFGSLTVPQSIRFMVVHHQHHRRILDEVVQAADRAPHV